MAAARDSSAPWAPPAQLSGQSVLPDRYTDATALKDLPGKTTDPGRMAIFLCLLDERPHLHPNLAALHKHRLTAHGIPLPADPSTDPPVTTREDGEKEWLSWKFSAEEEARRKAYLPLA